MRRIAELVDRRHRDETIAAVDKMRRRGRRLRHCTTRRGHGDAARASSRACACAPWRGGSNTTASKRQARTPRGALEQVAAFGRDRLEPGRGRGGALERSDRRLRRCRRRERARVSASRSANGPTPANRSAIFLASAHAASTSRAKTASPATVACRNAAGGKSRSPCRCARSAPALRHHFAMAGQPREVALLRDLRQRRGERRREGAGAANVDIEPGVRRRDVDIERLLRGQRAPRQSPRRPRSRRRAVARTGQRSMAIRWWVRAAEKPTSSMSCVPRRACNTARRRPSPWASIRSPTGASMPAWRSAVDDEIALPRAVGAALPMLQAQPPQTPKCGQIGAMRSALGCLDAKQMPPVRMAGTSLDFDRLARQRAGHVNRPVRAVRRRRRRDGRADRSSGAQPRSASMKNSRLPSPPRIADGTIPPMRQPSEARNAPMSSQTATWTPRRAQCLS